MSMKPSPAPTPPDPLSERDAVVDVSSLDSEARASFEAYGSGIAVGAVQLRRAHAGVIAHVGGGTRLRPEREAALDALLAPGATKAVGAGNRPVPEEPDEHRLCFEVDLDRVKHSPAFRRLAGKTQVVLNAAGIDDHLRNRLTHALEVAQVATAVARVTGLNVALVEASALAHDCGHGPAGHASEEAFSPYVPGGVYDHAVWGADVVLAGLNLCAETTDAVRNHSWKRPAPLTPEGELVAWADRIAYVCHDADDAARAGIISRSQLPAALLDVAGPFQGGQVGFFVKAMIDAIDATGQVGMAESPALVLDAFRQFNYSHIYLRPASRHQATRAISMLRELVEFHADAPGRIPDVASGSEAFPTSGSPEAALAAVHYVSSMTDHYATTLAAELLGFDATRLLRPA